MKIHLIDSIEVYGQVMRKMRFSLLRNSISIEHLDNRSMNLAAAPVKMLIMLLELT